MVEGTKLKSGERMVVDTNEPSPHLFSRGSFSNSCWGWGCSQLLVQKHQKLPSQPCEYYYEYVNYFGKAQRCKEQYKYWIQFCLNTLTILQWIERILRRRLKSLKQNIGSDTKTGLINLTCLQDRDKSFYCAPSSDRSCISGWCWAGMDGSSYH